MARIDVYHVVKKPLITEQGMHLVQTQNTYPFAVDPRANKVQIRKAIEEIFSVKVVSVNTAHRKGKARRRGRRISYTSSWKKAFVTLKEGDTIELF